MSDKHNWTRFTLDDLKQPELRDKDNAAPRIKPPTLAEHPLPSIAPPGMSGIKTMNKRFTFEVSLKPEEQKKVTLGEAGRAKKAFKPLVQSPPGKDLGRSR